MNPRTTLLIAFCILLPTQLPVIAQQTAEIPIATPEDVGMSTQKLQVVDKAMQSLVDDGKMIGGIAMIARKGKICFFEDYGLANREAGQAMRKDSILRFYSMTKAITTTAILMLSDEGKLDVNDPVSKYLPELSELTVISGEGTAPSKNAMTLADLLRHTSGLTYGYSKNKLHNELFKKHAPTDKKITLAEMPARLKQVPLNFEPSTAWEYGISIDVLGRVIEVVSGKTLEQFLDERLFTPLDMPDTGFHVPKDKAGRFATCYRTPEKEKKNEPKDDTGKQTFDYKAGFALMPKENTEYLTPPAFQSGGGGLVSTARDYMRFLMMIERGGELNGRRYLKPETVKLMTTNQTPPAAGWVRFGDETRVGVGFSFGFSVRDKMSDWDPASRVGEYGWGGAASTHYWISPKDELIVITLEQVRPYRWLTEFEVKKQIYDAIVE